MQVMERGQGLAQVASREPRAALQGTGSAPTSLGVFCRRYWPVPCDLEGEEDRSLLLRRSLMVYGLLPRGISAQRLK